jgi:ATP-dependent DNA helicase PIF1
MTSHYVEFLNPKQKLAFHAILDGKSIFLTGPGGTGKSFLLNLVHDAIHKETAKTIALTALTGCAALLLHPKAKTLHSWAGIGLGTDAVPLLVKAIKKSRRAHLRWVSTDILVIDEISMMTPELFAKLDEIGRKVRKCEHRPFGGLQLVLVGDFFQLPPVVKQEGDEKVDTAFVFESPLWQDLKLQTIELTEGMRQKDTKFQTILNEARRGDLTKPSLRVLASRMGLDYTQSQIKPTMLFTRRVEVDRINMEHLKKLTTERQTFKASTVFLPIPQTQGLSESDPNLLQAVAKLDGNAQYTPNLVLAIGAQVMLITNKDPESGLVNGSRGVVVGYSHPTLQAQLTELKTKQAHLLALKTRDPSLLTESELRILPTLDQALQETETQRQLLETQQEAIKLNPGTEASICIPIVKFRNGEQLPIEHATWEVPDMPGVLRRQIPLRLAYAITIHKSQGSTLDCALIDVGEKTFEFGQAYVALSRVKDLESLYIHDLSASAFKSHPKVKAFYDTSLQA